MDRPNIIVILVDDMGYSDIGCYGGPVRTANLDALAAGGLRYTQFYNTARCCPARASLLTGLYPHQAGMGWMTAADLGTDGYAGDLNRRCRTIAEVLRPAGYATYMSGKWHLTHVRHEGPGGPKHSWPRQRGFGRYFGTICGGGSYWTPRTLTVDNEQIDPPEGFYYTDAISDRAVQFVDDHVRTRGGDPFFLYVAYTAPHWPLHARAEDVAAYRGRFREGWDVLRRQKFERMREMGILDEGWGLSERGEGIRAWDELSPEEQVEMDLRMAIYAAQIECVDRGVGRLIECLTAHGLLDNTLVLFLSDNGGCHEEVHRKSRRIEDLGADASFESYGRPWANTSNVPFREYKSWTHEGGIATPLIAHWPARIGEGGRFRHRVGHLIDVMPTCVELAGAEYPSDPKEGVWPMEGESLAPSFAADAERAGAIFWEHEGNRAVRLGKWKLVAKGVEGAWELYDTSADRTELTDLSAEQPDRVERMAGMWRQYAERTYVLPLDGRTWSERIDDPLRLGRPPKR